MASKPTPSYYTPLPADITPEELNFIQYHRNNLDAGTYMRQPDGDITTVYGGVFGDPAKGPGKLIPTYWHGSIRAPDEATRFAIKSGVQFPTYDSVKTALDREQFLHNIIEADTNAFKKSKKIK
jgi:hypothetical protein